MKYKIYSLALILLMPMILSAQTSPCGEPGDGTINLSPEGFVEQSSTYFYSSFNSGDVSRSTDGILSGDESNTSRTQIQMNPWWEANLNDSYILEGISIWYPENHYPNGFENYYILMSEFPFSSTDLNTELASPFVEHIYVENALPSGFEVPLEFRHAQYIRVQLDGFGDITVFEIQIPGGGGNEENCFNGIDDDCDGRIDCEDTDCAPVMFNVTSKNPTCPICNDGEIEVQAFGENLQYSLDGGENFESFPAPTQIRLFDDLDEGNYHLMISNGICTIEYKNNPIVIEAIEGTPVGDCGNGDFEEGTYEDWTGGLGNRQNLEDGEIDNETIVINNIDIDIDNQTRHRILPSGSVDPFIPTLDLTPPDGGQYFVRLGNFFGGPQAERLTYCFDVDNENADFHFNFAVVLENPHNNPLDNPLFQYRIYESNSGLNIVEPVVYNADPNDDFFEEYNPEAGTDFVYKGWTCAGFELSEFIGQNVCIEFITADCALEDHFGYAYIDGLCTDIEDQTPVTIIENNICPDEIGDYYVDGSNTIGENQYTWTVCTFNDLGEEENCISQNYLNDVGQINISEFYPDFECGNRYRVKLLAWNDCTTADEEVIDIFVSCFDIDYFDYIYCTDELSVPIQGIVNCSDECTFVWEPNDPFSIDDFTTAFPNVRGFPQGGGTKKYSVTVTDENGCSLNEEVFIGKFSEPSVDLSYELIDNCDYNFLAQILTTFPRDDLKVVLTNTTSGQEYSPLTIDYIGETGTGEHNAIYEAIIDVPINDLNSGDIFSVSVELDLDNYEGYDIVDECIATDTVIFFLNPLYRGPFAPMFFPNIFTPHNQDGINDEWIIYAPVDYTSYNAYWYHLIIFGENGSVIYDVEGERDLYDPPFSPEHIKWDGKVRGCNSGIFNNCHDENGNSVTCAELAGGLCRDSDGNVRFWPVGVYVYMVNFENCDFPRVDENCGSCWFNCPEVQGTSDSSCDWPEESDYIPGMEQNDPQNDRWAGTIQLDWYE